MKTKKPKAGTADDARLESLRMAAVEQLADKLICQARAGAGWLLLGKHLREALVSHEVVMCALGQTSQGATLADMVEVARLALAKAGDA